MAMEFGVVLAALMGAAAALMGGVLAQRYQYMLEKQRDHFAVLRDNVLAPWPRAIAARQANLEGRDPYVVIDFVAKDYRSSPGVSFGTGDQVPWTEKGTLALASKKHWPALWKEWAALNQELVALGDRAIGVLRKVEADMPPLPPGKTWSNYGDDPAMAVRVAVVNLWASHAQAFERRTYPDWVVGQLTQFGFWRGEGDEEQRRAYAKAVAATLDRHAADVAALDTASEAVSKRFAAFGGKVDHAIHAEVLPGRCEFCPRFLR
jgi:hypothetical protein